VVGLEGYVVSLFTLLSGPVVAAPVVFDFANLKYSGGINTGFLPTDGIACSGGDLCSSNIASSLSGDLSFTNGGLTVHAKGSYNGGAFGSGAAVVQDHENGYNGKLSGKDAIGAGLGVYHLGSAEQLAIFRFPGNPVSFLNKDSRQFIF
jgi:hypothetical protein